MIELTVFLLIIGETEFQLDHNQKKNYRYGHIPFNWKGMREAYLCVHLPSATFKFIPAVPEKDLFFSMHKQIKGFHLAGAETPDNFCTLR